MENQSRSRAFGRSGYYLVNYRDNNYGAHYIVGSTDPATSPTPAIRDIICFGPYLTHDLAVEIAKRRGFVLDYN